MWTELRGSRHRSLASCFEHGDGIFSIKISEILGRQRYYQCRNEKIAQAAQLASRIHPGDEPP
jgi:hypothetical protein